MTLKMDTPWGWELVWAVKPETVGRVFHIRRGNRFWLEPALPAESGAAGGAHAGGPGERTGGPGGEQVVLCAGLLMLVRENALGQLEETVLRPGDVPLESVTAPHRMIALEDVALLAITPSARAELVHVDDS